MRVIREMLHIDAMLKWPNDILVNDRKISGMLSELEAEADRVFFISIGMGINVNNDPSNVEPSAISLKNIVGREVSRKALLARFLDSLSDRMNNLAVENVITEWKQNTVTIGRHVRIITQREESVGLAVDVDENGALILELAGGERKKIIYGDCFLEPES